MLDLAIYPFAAIGALFVVLQAIGHALNGLQAWIALDQWVATCLIYGALADETISAWAHRKQHKRTERAIDWLFRDENHCAKAYLAEMLGEQNAREYRDA